MDNISNKVKLIIFFICLIVLFSTVSSTYSRYVSAVNGTVTTDFARWQIFVNNENIIENYGTTMTFTPTIEPNKNVAANKIAPSSKGYFDVFINPSNVDVSFTYDINITVPEDSLITDIKVTDYAIVEGTEITDETEFSKISLESNIITDTLLYDNTTANFSFKPFIMRLYFSWLDDETGTMDDQDDSNVANMIANGEDVNFDLGISINFKQYIGETDDDNDISEIPSEGNDSGSENTDIVEDNTVNHENTEPVVE